MTRYLKTMPLVAALALLAPTASFAQESNGAATEDDNTRETQSIDEQLSLGEDPEAAAGVGQPYTREVIGAWEMRCIKAAEESNEEEPCQMYQLLDDGEGAPVAEVSLFRLPPGGQAIAGATVIVPLETSLPQQMTMRIDGGDARRYPFAFCNPVGCYVRLGLTEADVTAMKRGNEAVLSIVPALAPDQTVELPVSLEGFTASYDKVSVIDQ